MVGPGGIPGGVEHTGEPSPGGSRKAGPRVPLVALAVLAVHLGVVCWLTLRPAVVVWVPPDNAVLFATIRAELAQGPGHAVRSLGGELLLLAPLGLLLPALGRRLWGARTVSFCRTVFTGAMIALLFQLAGSTVPGEVADVDVLLLRCLGIAGAHLLGFGLLRAALLRPGARRPVPVPQGRTPRGTGVGIGPGADVRRGPLPLR